MLSEYTSAQIFTSWKYTYQWGFTTVCPAQTHRMYNQSHWSFAALEKVVFSSNSLWCELLYQVTISGFCCCISLGILAVWACSRFLADVLPPCWFCVLHWKQLCFQKNGTFCAVASVCITWLKFLQLKTIHSLHESMTVVGFFWLKTCSNPPHVY